MTYLIMKGKKSHHWLLATSYNSIYSTPKGLHTRNNPDTMCKSEKQREVVAADSNLKVKLICSRNIFTGILINFY